MAYIFLYPRGRKSLWPGGGVCNVKFGNPMPAAISLAPNQPPHNMPVPICPRKDFEQGLILRGIKCQTAPSWDFNNFAVTVYIIEWWVLLTCNTHQWCRQPTERSYSLNNCYKKSLSRICNFFILSKCVILIINIVRRIEFQSYILKSKLKIGIKKLVKL